MMKNSSSLLYGFMLLVGDFLALLAAFSMAYIIRVKIDDRSLIEQIPAGTFLAVFAVLLVFWLIIFALLQLYRPKIYENRFAEAGRIFIGCFVGILFLIGCEYVLNEAIFPARLVMLYGFVCSFLLVLLFRTVARGTRHLLFMRGVGLNHVLLVGNTSVMRELATSLQDPRSGYRVVGLVGDKRYQYGKLPTEKIFASFGDAIAKLKKVTVHSIVQTELYAEQSQNDEVLSYAQQNHIAYRFVPGNSSLLVGNIEVDLFRNIPVIAVHQTALTGWGRIIKRLFDLGVSFVSIIILLPLMALIFVLLTLTGGGALYAQTRLTRFNTKIKVYKFRSHKHKYHRLTPEEAFAKMGKPELAKQYRASGDRLPKDPRISRLGRILRATSLDELPQLFNVFKGDVSLVGPRALVPEELELYPKRDLILSVKSGITGLAQISGRRDLPFEERRKLDIYYAQNWSFWLDITILLKTSVQLVARVFKGQSD